MKKIYLIAVATLLAAFLFPILFSESSHAQQTETLFSGNATHGGFGGPVVKIGEVAGSTGVWVGGRGGWIINLDRDHAISLGGGGYGLVTDHRTPIDNDLYALNGYGGFIIEYTNQSARLVHFTASALLGGGGLMLRDRNYEDVQDDIDSYFVFEPALQAELNVTNFFRIAAGASYRMTSGIGRFGFSDSDFSGLNGVITLKFGKFL
jgi:hypothetical protein